MIFYRILLLKLQDIQKDSGSQYQHRNSATRRISEKDNTFSYKRDYKYRNRKTFPQINPLKALRPDCMHIKLFIKSIGISYINSQKR